MHRTSQTAGDSDPWSLPVGVPRLAGKVALVTGAGRGIGQSCAIRMALEGAAVVAIDVAGAEEVADRITARGHSAISVAGSVADRATWDAGVQRARDAFGRIDALVNVAAVQLPLRDREDTLLSLTDDDLDWLFSVNFRGPVLGMQAVMPLMLEQGSGSIVNFLSGAANRGIPNHAGYSATKGALQSLTRQVAVEYSPRGVRVNAVAPGPIRTPMSARTPKHIQDEIEAGIPLRRVGLPEDCASVVVFLASDESAFMTGASVPVDGGNSVR